MWKMLYPGETRGGDHKSENQNRKSAVSFERFAKDKFKATKHPSNQTLAILNYSAEMWKMLYPEETRGGDHKSENQNCKNTVLFDDFSKANFKVSQSYAKQALAILNYLAVVC